MALTKNGNRTGRAGADELAEQRQMIYASQLLQADLKHEAFQDALGALKFLDPEGWSAWYDEHVPSWLGWQNSQPAIDVMWVRVNELLGERDPREGRDEAELDRLHEIVTGLVHESSVAQTEAVL